MIAPAARRRATAAASAPGRVWAKGLAPPVVGMPATSKMSFTPIGTPCSGPRRRPARASRWRSRAVARAPSASTKDHAVRRSSRPRIRARHASTRSMGLTRPARTPSAALRAPSRASSTEDIEHLGHDLEAPERRHQIGARVAGPHVADELLRHLHAGAEGTIPRVAQPPADHVGNRDARHLVVEELGVAGAVQREDPDEDGDGRAARAGEEALEELEVVDGLRLYPARPRLHLAVEALDLPLDVLGRGVQGSAD